MSPQENRAHAALSLIIPLLEKYELRWVITGGFACYVYGVPRDITDIDIDIEASKDAPKFKELYNELKPYVSSELEHFVDENYDNYTFEITSNDQIIDFCSMPELKLFNTETSQYELFYKKGFPEVELVDFFGFTLPLLSKTEIIANKEKLTSQRDIDKRDIEGLRALMMP